MQTAYTHKKLVAIAYDWAFKKWRLDFAFADGTLDEFDTNYAFMLSGEIPDIIAFRSGISILIEVKTSRNDFIQDQKKPFRQKSELGMGNYRFYCCPKGLIKVNELKPNWGLLYVDENEQIKCIRNPMKLKNAEYTNGNFFEKNIIRERKMIYQALKKVHKKKRNGHFSITKFPGSITVSPPTK